MGKSDNYSHRCVVPGCEIELKSRDEDDHKHMVHLFYRAQKCLLCKDLIYHSATWHVEQHLKSSSHGIKENVRQYVGEVNYKNPFVFGNKKSEFIPNLRFNISDFLEELMRDFNTYDDKITDANNVFHQLHPNIELTYHVHNEEDYILGSSIPNKVSVYFKIGKWFLNVLQQNNQELTVVKFIIGILTGYVGRSCNIENRQQGHYASMNEHLTIELRFNQTNLYLDQAIENVVLKLFNVKNMLNNELMGNNYYIDNFTLYKHIYFTIGILQQIFSITKNYLNFNKLSIYAVQLLNTSLEEVPTENFILDKSIKLTKLSDLKEGMMNINIYGECVNKRRYAAGSKKTGYVFDLFDLNTQNSIAIFVMGEEKDQIFYSIVPNKFYLIKNVNVVSYRAYLDLIKLRIEISSKEQFNQVNNSNEDDNDISNRFSMDKNNLILKDSNEEIKDIYKEIYGNNQNHLMCMGCCEWFDVEWFAKKSTFFCRKCRCGSGELDDLEMNQDLKINNDDSDHPSKQNPVPGG